MNNEQLIRCDNCGRRSKMKEAVKVRPVEGHPGIEETGIDCPKCGIWIHSKFDGEALARFRARLQEAADVLTKAKGNLKDGQLDFAVKEYYRAKKRMNVEHQRFNQIWRKKLDVKSPSELIGELKINTG